jgi:hypothetical protein
MLSKYHTISIPIPIAISIRYSPQDGAGVNGGDHAAAQLIVATYIRTAIIRREETA